MFQTSQQIERLETVDPQCFKKIIVRRQLLARHFEMRGSKTKNFIERVVSSRHVAISNYKLPITNCKFTASTAADPHSPQISAALLRQPDAYKGRRKFRSPASVPHTES